MVEKQSKSKTGRRNASTKIDFRLEHGARFEKLPLLPEHFANRELSLLQFFRRVLSMADEAQTPLLERLRFLAICSTITDEFFEIRVAGIKQRIQFAIGDDRPDELGQVAVLNRINTNVTALLKEQYRLLNESVLPLLEDAKVRVFKRQDWSAAQKDWTAEYFQREVAPVLTPVGLDTSHPFPRVLNKSLNMIVSIQGEDAFGRASTHAVVPVPRCLPRLIRLPEAISGTDYGFVMLSSMIHEYVEAVFPGMEILGCHQFRLTRNADLWVEEEEVEDLLDALRGELFRRRYGDAVRLEVAHNCPITEVELLQAQFGLDPVDVYRVDGPVNLHRLDKIYDIIDRPDLKFRAFTPASLVATKEINLFERLKRGDVLLHHPFESFSPVVELVRQGATDPSVLAIKQTVYRSGKNSPMVEALVDAARAGKEVTAVVELRARFDEAANIDLATRLQDAGANVVYGVVGYKTHAKMLLIVRREQNGIRRYAHLGTGNYHTGTSRAYTDFGLMTADDDFTEDVHTLFMQLTGLGKAIHLKKLLQSPFTLQPKLIEFLADEVKEARAGNDAYVCLKLNTLSDPTMIKALYAASMEGVKIELIVRGVCCLIPGIPGISDNVTVRSVVGRFLEHSRIFFFRAGGANKTYLASADWMVRNLYRRIETCFPIEDEKLKQRVIEEGLKPYLLDTQGAWEMRQDTTFQRCKPKGKAKPFSAQKHLLQLHQNRSR